MTPTGLERNFVSSNYKRAYRESLNPSDVESDVNADASHCKEGLPDDLAYLFEAWARLSTETKRSILEAVQRDGEQRNG